MNLNFNETAETKSGDFVSKLRPGTYDDIFITGFETFEPTGKSPYIEVTLVAENGSGQHKEKLYMSDAARPYSLAKIKELLEATYNETGTITDTGSVANALIGKKIALRLWGEEVELSDGKVVIVAHVSAKPFCAPVGKVGTLPYDALKAIKKLPAKVAPATTDNDLPF